MLKIAIIGRPNVGKSTLFNRLIGRQISVTDDRPGVTRDRLETIWQRHNGPVLLVDTGGWDDQARDDIGKGVTGFAQSAVQDADIVLFVVDGSTYLTALDEILALNIRKNARRIALLINKADIRRVQDSLADISSLGIGPVLFISAAHGTGIDELETLIDQITDSEQKNPAQPSASIAVLGRPNVGKSTLVNAILNDTRVLVDKTPGTTRDPVDTWFSWHEKLFCLIDTAGIRRAARREDRIEHKSVNRALVRLEKADIAILVIDAAAGVTDGDLRVGNIIQELSKPVIIAANKWDTVQSPAMVNPKLRRDIQQRFHFLPWASVMTVAAKTRLRVPQIIVTAWDILNEKPNNLPQLDMTAILKQALRKQPPPRFQNRTINVGPARLINDKPISILIFSSQAAGLSDDYRRFLQKHFMRELKLTHLPLKFIFRDSRKKT